MRVTYWNQYREAVGSTSRLDIYFTKIELGLFPNTVNVSQFNNSQEAGPTPLRSKTAQEVR